MKKFSAGTRNVCWGSGFDRNHLDKTEKHAILSVHCIADESVRNKVDTVSYLKSLLYMLFFSVVLPAELLIWGQALDTTLANTYLAKRLRLSLFFDLPRSFWLAAAILALAAILFAAVELGRKSHRCDILLFCGFPYYMFSLFVFFNMPCTAAIGTGLIILTAWAVWFIYPKEDRPPFPLPDDLTVTATPVQRLTAVFFLLGILAAGMLIFQEGYQLWLAFQWTPLLVIVPLAGIILPTPGQLREYLIGGAHSLALGALIYGIGQWFPDSSLRTDWSIVSTYIFLELLVSQMIRPILPRVRNNSLIILGLSSLVTFWIMPPICSVWIVTLSMYVLYLVIDNRKAILKKMFYRTSFRRTAEVHLLSWEEYAAQAWGFGGLLAAWLAGPQQLPQILIGLGAVLLAGLIRSRLLNDLRSEHLILKSFPYALEISALLLSVMFSCSWTDSSCSVGGTSLDMVMILLSIYAAVSCVMQMIWNIGGLVGRYTQERPALQMCHVFCQFGMGFLLIMLFFIQAPASVLLGCFCILTGIIRIADNSFLKKQDKRPGLTAAWVLIIIGQFVFVSSSETILPEPEWSLGAPVCALVSCAALYVYRLFDFSNRNRRIAES